MSIPSIVKDGEFHTVTLGDSFNNQSAAVHTLRYDFKPKSVDDSQNGLLNAGEYDNVTVRLPHFDNKDETIYRGNKRPVTKECILIIDNNTGAMRLEKVNYSIALKKTRENRKPTPAELTPKIVDKVAEEKEPEKATNTLPSTPPSPAPQPESVNNVQNQKKPDEDTSEINPLTPMLWQDLQLSESSSDDEN